MSNYYSELGSNEFTRPLINSGDLFIAKRIPTLQLGLKTSKLASKKGYIDGVD